MEIGVVNGRVAIMFPQDVNWVHCDPENARLIGEAISRAAYTSTYGVEPPSLRSKVSDALREKLVNRITIVLASLETQKKSPLQRAQAVVDIILNEAS